MVDYRELWRAYESQLSDLIERGGLHKISRTTINLMYKHMVKLEQSWLNIDTLIEQLDLLNKDK